MTKQTNLVFGVENLEEIFVQRHLKPIEDLEILFNKPQKNKSFINERDKYFKNWIGVPTRFIKLNNLTEHVGGAQIWSKVVSDANGGAHKIYNATVHCLLAKRSGKKII